MFSGTYILEVDICGGGCGCLCLHAAHVSWYSWYSWVSWISWFSCSWCLWSASLELGPIPRAGAGWSPSLSAVGVLTAGVEVTGGAALCWLHWPGPPARAN